MCTHTHTITYACKCVLYPWSPEETVESPGAGDDNEQPTVGSGSRTWVLCESSTVLNRSAHSNHLLSISAHT